MNGRISNCQTLKFMLHRLSLLPKKTDLPLQFFRIDSIIFL